MKKILMSLAIISASASDDVTAYNIYAIISSQIQNQLNDVNLGLKKFNLHGLSEEGYVPHVTLYLSTFKKINYLI